ncbi:MAG: hypothetical protein C4557_11400 [Anaerolineaceae bacterium]|nr:MAG: hypothetical protein C4557_11400 [Anaerolineaceae bacterium]
MVYFLFPIILTRLKWITPERDLRPGVVLIFFTSRKSVIARTFSPKQSSPARGDCFVGKCILLAMTEILY